MGNCSVCNNVVSQEQGRVYTADQLRYLVSRGFEPPAYALDSMLASSGMTNEQKLAYWKTSVVANNTSNWVFCPYCSSQASRFMPSSNAAYSRPSGRAWGRIALFSALGLVVLGALAATLGFVLGWFGGDGPEKTLDAYFESMENKNSAALTATFSPASRQEMVDETNGCYVSIEDLLGGAFSGYQRIDFEGVEYKAATQGETASVELVSGTVTMADESGSETTVDLQSSGAPVVMELVKEDGEWYIDYGESIANGGAPALNAIQREIDPSCIPVGELLAESAAAGQSITSMRQEVALAYDTTAFGSGTVQSRLIEISGNNVHAVDYVLGDLHGETILVDGRQFGKVISTGEWVESQTTMTPSSVSDSDKLTELMSTSRTQKNLGVEQVGDYTCIHLQFELSPDDVREVASPQVQQDTLVDNTGGTLDIWVDRSKPCYMVRSTGRFNNVTIPSIGNLDLTVDITRSSINQPITIEKPF